MGGNQLPINRSAFAQVLFILIMIGLNAHIYYEEKDDKVVGKTVLITGCTSKLGQQIAFKFSELGANVLLIDYNLTQLNVIGRICHEKGAQSVKTIAADLKNSGSQLIKELKQNLTELDILVINQPEIDLKQWTNSAENISNMNIVVKENFLFQVHLTSALLVPLEKTRGRIAVVTTDASKIGTAGTSLLSANNEAMHGFYTTLNSELKLRKTGVTVTTAEIDLVDSPAIYDDSYLRWEEFKRQLNSMEVEAAADMIVTPSAGQISPSGYHSNCSSLHIFISVLTPNKSITTILSARAQ